jgi:hypothetical protein
VPDVHGVVEGIEVGGYPSGRERLDGS